ncbi:MAG: DUF2062 domain-containing protein [Polyangiaceae bacterium]
MSEDSTGESKANDATSATSATSANKAPPKKFSLFREELKRMWKDLRGGAMTPRRAAISVALGLFIGSQPIFGCHTPLVIAICLWFQLDAALAWMASHVSNPFFAPFLMTGEVQTGAYLRNGEFLQIDQEVMKDGFKAISVFAEYLFLGSPLVGVGLALVGGCLTFGLVAAKRSIWPSDGKREPYRLPDNAPPWIQATERTAGRYVPPEDSTPQQRTRFHYVRIKLLMDPIAQMVAEYGRSIEGGLGSHIGTGAGPAPDLGRTELRWASAGRCRWTGTTPRSRTPSPPRRAERAIPPRSLRFSSRATREAELPPADTVLLIDLLHYFKPEEQEKILRNAARSDRRVRILIREADNGAARSGAS